MLLIYIKQNFQKNLVTTVYKKNHFADKGPYSQSHGFSSSDTRMWELNHKEGWAPKNWCFQTVVLEKTLESPLDSKESKLVNPKGNQPEYSLEGLMLKLKLQYFGHLMQRANSLEKHPDAGKDWSKKEKRETKDKMVGWHHRLNGYDFEQTLGDMKDREPGVLQSVHRVVKSQTQLCDWTTTATTTSYPSGIYPRKLNKIGLTFEINQWNSNYHY